MEYYGGCYHIVQHHTFTIIYKKSEKRVYSMSQGLFIIFCDCCSCLLPNEYEIT